MPSPATCWSGAPTSSTSSAFGARSDRRPPRSTPGCVPNNSWACRRSSTPGPRRRFLRWRPRCGGGQTADRGIIGCRLRTPPALEAPPHRHFRLKTLMVHCKLPFLFPLASAWATLSPPAASSGEGLASATTVGTSGGQAIRSSHPVEFYDQLATYATDTPSAVFTEQIS